MATGRDRHEARKALVASLGRTLTRRAKSHCELCGDSGSLRVMEVPPFPEEPAEDSAILACDRCRDLPGAKRLDDGSLRFLESSVWSEILPVQVMAISLMRRLGEDSVGWATACLDTLWIDEEVAARLGDG